jgi:hypothetical protein
MSGQVLCARSKMLEFKPEPGSEVKVKPIPLHRRWSSPALTNVPTNSGTAVGGACCDYITPGSKHMHHDDFEGR